MSFDKDPDATLDFSVNWEPWLAGDTIASSTWVVPDGLTKASESSSDARATVWLSGGTHGKFYPVVNRVTTAGGRTDDRTLVISVHNR